MNSLQQTIASLYGSHDTRAVPGDLAVPESGERTFHGGKGLRETLLGELAERRANGWLLWSEGLETLLPEAGPPVGEGWLLAAELHFPDADESLHVRQHGTDWRATLWRRVAGDSAFLETRDLLPWPQLREVSGRVLRYEVAWRLRGADPCPAFRPAVYRFLGFTESANPSQS